MSILKFAITARFAAGPEFILSEGGNFVKNKFNVKRKPDL
jgi:hypothetical protein